MTDSGGGLSISNEFHARASHFSRDWDEVEHTLIADRRVPGTNGRSCAFTTNWCVVEDILQVRFLRFCFCFGGEFDLGLHPFRDTSICWR